ncbi:MAG: DUF4870 domain-containing protein [Planctomycetota bacterium]|jgi:uncharacterized Tic20 family protein
MEEIDENPINPGVPESKGQSEQKDTPAPGQQEEKSQVDNEIDKDARMWSMFCHLGGLAGIIPLFPVIGSIIVPFIIWQVKKDDHMFINENGKEALNFQLSIFIYYMASLVLCFACLGFILLPAVFIFKVIFVIIASLRANEGKSFRYPLCIRFIM